LFTYLLKIFPRRVRDEPEQRRNKRGVGTKIRRSQESKTPCWWDDHNDRSVLPLHSPKHTHPCQTLQVMRREGLRKWSLTPYNHKRCGTPGEKNLSTTQLLIRWKGSTKTVYFDLPVLWMVRTWLNESLTSALYSEIRSPFRSLLSSLCCCWSGDYSLFVLSVVAASLRWGC